jgi:predicted nucleotidyltransferase
MHFDLKKHTILLTAGGSVAYGMALPSSDLDVKGIAVAPESTTLGFSQNFEQVDGEKHLDVFLPEVRKGQDRHLEAMKNGFEGVVYDLRKFMTLASKGNPNILEVLFCDDDDVLHCTSEGKKLRENRNLFLSQVVRHSYTGYAVAQLKRIKGHKNWLLNPKEDKPSRKEFGLGDNPSIPRHRRSEIEAAIAKNVDRLFTRDQAIKLVAEYPAFKNDFEGPGFIGFLNAEHAFGKAMEEWTRYQTWRSERNEKRAVLEVQFGYDTKHAAHLVRLLRTGEELLRDGVLLVRRPDAKELLAIRAGEWPYEKLVEWAEEKVKMMDEWKEKSALPHSPDMNKLNELCIEVHKDFYSK